MTNRFWLGWSLLALLLVSPSLLAADFVASEAIVEIDGDGDDLAGFSVASVGDINDDGTGDFIVTAPGASTINGAGSGRAFIVLGGTGVSSVVDLAAPGVGETIEILGPSAGAALGAAACSAGDFNGDGIADVAISAPGADYSGRIGAGVVYVVFGGATIADSIDTSSLGTEAIEIGGSEAGASFGSSAASAGDFNDDGVDDLVIGAPEAGVGGVACVVYGSSTLASTVDSGALATDGISYDGVDVGARFGASCAGGGDVNDDLFADIAVGAPLAGLASAGKLYVIFGSASPSAVDLSALTAASDGAIEVDGAASGDELGVSCAILGDFNTDGVDDVAIGASAALDGRGVACVVFGTSTLSTPLDASDLGSGGFTIEGLSVGDTLGTEVVAIGDFSGDGVADLAVSAPGYDSTPLTDSGIVYVIPGSSLLPAVLTGVALTTAGHTFSGEASSASFGESVSGAVDIDGDGSSDLVVGAPDSEPLARPGAGSAFVFAAPPFLQASPANAAICELEDVNFEVIAAGAGTLSYQWRFNGVDILNATSNTYSILGATVSDAGFYDVAVTGTGGTTFSAEVFVDVSTPVVVVSADPTDQDVCVADSVNLSVLASGPGFLGYQWRRNSVDLPGEIASDLSVVNATTSDAGDYDVVITDSSATSDDIRVASGTFLTPSLTGVSQVVDTLDFTPVAIMLRGVATTDTRVHADISHFVGFADNAGNERSIVVTSDSGGDDTRRVVNEAACLAIMAPVTDLAIVEASVTSFDVNGFTLDFSTSSSGYAVSYVAFGGADLEAIVGEELTTATPLAGLAFAPDLVFTATAGLSGAGGTASSTRSTHAHGVLSSNGQYWTGSYVGSDVLNQDSIHSATYTGEFIGHQYTSKSWGLVRTSMNTDGWSWTSSLEDVFYYLAISTGDRAVTVGDFAKETTGVVGVTQELPDLGFIPQVVGFSSGGKTTTADIAAGCAVTHGQASETHSSAWLFTQPINGSNADQRQDSDHVLMIGDTDATVVAGAAMTRFHSTSPTLTWSPNDTNGYVIGYWAIEAVSVVCDPIVSATAIVTVSESPTILTDPVGATICPGEDAILSVTAGGGEPLTYQWRKDSIDVPGATQETLDILVAVADDSGSYDVVVSNSCGAITSVGATVIVAAVPSVSELTAEQTVCLGDEVSFSVVATSDVPLSYQWRLAGVDITGATDATLTILSTVLGDAGDYDVVVTNSCGSIDSGLSSLVIVESPVLDVHPANVTLCVGEEASLLVSASSALPASFQWRYEGLDIVGETGMSLTIPVAVADDDGNYDVVVTNTCGSTVSESALLTVADVPNITTALLSETICADSAVTFSVVAESAIPLLYQWRLEGVDIVGEVGETLTVDPVLPSDEGDYEVVVTNDCGETTSLATLTVATVPDVTSQPESATVCSGGAVTFSVVATSVVALSYQWRHNGVDLVGQDGNALTIDPIGATDAGDYDVAITNACGSVDSGVATLTLAEVPEITSGPASETACVGDDVTLIVVATSELAVSYQWRLDEVNIAGAIADSLALESVGTLDDGLYDVVLTNDCGSSTSLSATVTVAEVPTIVEDPVAVTICAGGDVAMSVSATSVIPLSYQWRRDEVEIPDATADSLTLETIGVLDGGLYDVVVTNTCGSTTSATASLTVSEVPTIAFDPAGQTICSGDEVTFAVEASSVVPLSYQWRFESVDIADATGETLTLAAVGTLDGGPYDVVVTNECGSITSATATLVVADLPAITVGPESQTACAGDTVTLSVSVDSVTVVSYQWQLAGVDLAGATTDTLILVDVQVADAGDYVVVVTNECGISESQVATLIVADTPEVVSEAASHTVDIDGAVTLSMVATSDETLTYQWQRNGIELPGETSETLTIDPMTVDDVGDYEIVFTNLCGSVTSPIATVRLPEFRRGDVNRDDVVNIADVIFAINWIFNDGPSPGCEDAADTNDDGLTDIADIIAGIQYQFQGGAAPPDPGPTECGPDPEEDPDNLRCSNESPGCA